MDLAFTTYLVVGFTFAIYIRHCYLGACGLDERILYCRWGYTPDC